MSHYLLENLNTSKAIYKTHRLERDRWPNQLFIKNSFTAFMDLYKMLTILSSIYLDTEDEAGTAKSKYSKLLITPTPRVSSVSGYTWITPKYVEKRQSRNLCEEWGDRYIARHRDLMINILIWPSLKFVHFLLR